MLAESNAPACQCNGGQPKNFLQPCLLLLLFQRPSHGYDLLDRLAQAGLSIGAPDPAAVYRMLRQMERDGMVISRWRSEEHTSELQSRLHLVCRLLLEKKKTQAQSDAA